MEYCWQFELEILGGWASLLAQMVKNLPTMQETQVQSLGQEDLLEKEMATHSSILTWKIPWTEDRDIVQEAEIKTIPKKKKSKRQNGCLRPYNYL